MGGYHLTGIGSAVNLGPSANVLTWDPATTAPGITETAQASTSGGSGAAGANLSITAQAGQAATGASNNGGNGANLILSSGAGGTSGSATAGTAGNVQVQSAGTTVATFGGSGFTEASTNVAITTGTTTLSASQYCFGFIKLTGSISGNVTVVFPATNGAQWIIDATGVTLNGHTVTAQANSNNWGTTIGVTNLYSIVYSSSVGKLYGTSLTP